MARYTDIDLLIDKVEGTTWYHINKNGELVTGANSETDIPLYKHSDIMRVLSEAPEADVAREIFEEIEKEIDLGLSVISKILNAKGGRANGKTVLLSKYDVFIEAKKFIAKLKKKYIPQCPDCKHFVGCEQAVWTGPCDDYKEGET